MPTKSEIGTCSDCGHYTRDGKCVSEGEHCDGWQDEDEDGDAIADALREEADHA